MEATTQHSAPPQLSPDGHWWWNGAAWEPAPVSPPAPVPVQAAPAPQAGRPAPAQVRSPYAPTGGADGLAVVSLILSLLWLAGLGSIAGMVVGFISRKRAGQERRDKSGVALAGIIVGGVGAAFAFLAILAAIAIPVFLNQRAIAVLSANLKKAAVLEEAELTATGHYGDTRMLRAAGLRLPADVELAVITASDTSYCLGARTNATVMYYSPDAGLQRASCAGGVAG